MSKSLGFSNMYNLSFNKNQARIIPFTRENGSIGYHLVDSNGTYLYNADNKDVYKELWQKSNQQSLRPFDNYMSGADRIEHLRHGNNLFLDIENNPNVNYNMPWYTLPFVGNYYVNKYGDIIEKYAQQYDINPDLIKAIMYNEGATGHDAGYNYYQDIQKTSKSQMPMNIRGDLWGSFNGTKYNTWDPDDNIKLGVQVIKQIQDSIHNPTVEKIGTLWNRTGAMEVNDYGARTKTIMENKPWER